MIDVVDCSCLEHCLQDGPIATWGATITTILIGVVIVLVIVIFALWRMHKHERDFKGVKDLRIGD